MTFAIGLKDNESVVKCTYVMHIAPSRLFWWGGRQEAMGAEKVSKTYLKKIKRKTGQKSTVENRLEPTN